MRRLWIVGAVVSSLLLAACGATANINQAISSIGGSSSLQVHLTADASGTGSVQAEGILSAVSIDMNYQSTNGGALSQSAGHVDSAFTVTYSGQQLIELRQVNTDLFVRVDLSALAQIPGLGVSAQQLSAFQLLLGGRWFEFSESLLKSFTTTTTIDPAQSSKAQAAARAMIDAITALIEKTPYTTLPSGGYSQTGTLESVANAVVPIVNAYTGRSIKPGTVKGTYAITFSMSGSTATGGSFSITAPNSKGANATIGLHASITHDNQAIVAPTGATIITRSMLTQLLGQVGGASSLLG